MLETASRQDVLPAGGILKLDYRPGERGRKYIVEDQAGLNVGGLVLILLYKTYTNSNKMEAEIIGGYQRVPLTDERGSGTKISVLHYPIIGSSMA